MARSTRSLVIRGLTSLARLMQDVIEAHSSRIPTGRPTAPARAEPHNRHPAPHRPTPHRPPSHTEQTAPRHTPFRPVQRFFTSSELTFYDTLTKAVESRFIIMSKVRLLDLVEPMGTEQDRLVGKSRCIQKHIDFVLLHPTTYAVVAALELDGLSHLRPEQIRRDEQKTRILQAAGIPLLRFSSLEAYTPAMIRERLKSLGLFHAASAQLAPAAMITRPAPTCGKCGRTMVLKQKDRGPFWACPGFPQCRNVIPGP